MQTEKSTVVKLNPPEKNNKPALFSFEDLSNEKGVLEALKTVSKALKSAGAEPLKLSGNDLNSVVAKALKGGRESGIRYKPLIFTFDDGQSIELRIKQTGDFYKVILGGNLVTGKTLPIKNQDDHQLAIKEIANAVSGNSKKYLAAIAKKAAKGDKLPKTTTSKKQQIKEMEKQRDEIKADIEAIDAEINRMNAEMDAGKKKDKNIGREWDSPYGRQKITDYEEGKPEFGMKGTYIVSSDDGSIRKYREDDIDRIIASQQEQVTDEYKNNQELAKKRIEAEAIAKSKKEEDIKNQKSLLDDFVAGKSSRDAELIKKTLVKMTNISGSVATLSQNIEKIINEGGYTSTAEENVIKDKSRVQYNRMNLREQEEFEKKQKEAGTKTSYRIHKKDGSFYEFGKTAYDYANYLKNKAA